jgi:hypothetical protein
VTEKRRRALIAFAIACVAAAILFMPTVYFFGLWLAPPRPVPSSTGVPPLLTEAIWARTEGGRATELRPINPITFAEMRACRARAAQTADEALRAGRRAECMKLLPAIQAADYLSGVHMRANHVEPGTWRMGLTQFATAAWLTRSWTKQELIDTLGERAEFGFGWRGVEAAAHGYFGTAAAALTLPQAALIAAFIGDRGVDPWCDPAAAAQLRRVVLDRMRDNLVVEETAVVSANAAELGLIDPPADHKPCER